MKTRLLVPVLCACVLWVQGCDDPRARLVAVQAAAEQSGDRTAAATALEADFREGRVTLGLALDHAFVTLERNEDTFVYVGAVLDMAERVSDSIPSRQEQSTILLFRLGRLAYQSAEAAYLKGDVALARSLVLSGPSRWQNEGYWLRYPDHDGLASMLLAVTGDRSEALRRLNSRPALDGPAEEALELIRSMPP
ncbi:MAG: hypothetical protein AAF297_06125 [Planctomycetota bacterium]